MITTMVGCYEPNGNEIYMPPCDAYGEYCYSIQDMCNHMPCAFHGHPGVRMVQNNGTGPLPVQLQVPPGHVVHQVLDENGTVRHFFLSPPLLPVGAHFSPSHASTPAPLGAPYYPFPTPTFAPPHFQPPQPPSHMQPAMNPQNMHGMIQPPPPQCNGQPPPQEESPPPTQLTLTQNDEKFQRPTYKFRRKSERSSKEKLMILPNHTNSIKREKRKNRDKYEDSYRMNGSSASGSNASEDGEYTMYTDYLSSLRPPVVSELSPYSVMVYWKPPDLAPDAEIDPVLSSSLQQSEITYDVMLCEKGKEGRYKSVYSGIDNHCNVNILKPATEYYISVQASLDEIRGSCVKGQPFRTPSVEPEAPQPPRLSARTKKQFNFEMES